jgi:PAS domain S-box-containing protein
MDIVRTNSNHNHLYFKYCVKTAIENENDTASLLVTKNHFRRNHTNWLKVQLDNVRFKYNAVLNTTGAHYIILDKQLRVVDFNIAAVGLIKTMFNKDIKIGDNIAEYLNEELLESVLLSCRRALAGESFIMERRISSSGNRHTWWSAKYSPAFGANNTIAGLIFNATDITAREVYEDRIALQNSKLRSISLMQSHNIRGPVCTLMGIMSLIKLEDNHMPAEYLPMIEETITLLDSRIRAIVERAFEV